jgi:hypothetical protein
MTLTSDVLLSQVKPSRMRCSCVGPCTGYDSCSNCPPLIVFAVIANYEGAVSISDASGSPNDD